MPRSELCRAQVEIRGIALCSLTAFLLTLSCPIGFCKAPVTGTKGVNPIWGDYHLKTGMRESDVYVDVVETKAGKAIKFHLWSQYNQDPEAPNIGELTGEAPLKGNTAVYVGGDGDGHCKVTFKFANDKLEVSCPEPETFAGFGVNPSGSYRHESRQRPSKKDMEPANP